MLYQAKSNGDIGVKGCQIEGDKMYNIIRFYKSGKRKILFKNVNLVIAQLHCKSDFTRKKDSKGNTIYFDGYILI